MLAKAFVKLDDAKKKLTLKLFELAKDESFDNKVRIAHVLINNETTIKTEPSLDIEHKTILSEIEHKITEDKKAMRDQKKLYECVKAIEKAYNGLHKHDGNVIKKREDYMMMSMDEIRKKALEPIMVAGSYVILRRTKPVKT